MVDHFSAPSISFQEYNFMILLDNKSTELDENIILQFGLEKCGHVLVSLGRGEGFPASMIFYCLWYTSIRTDVTDDITNVFFQGYFNMN